MLECATHSHIAQSVKRSIGMQASADFLASASPNGLPSSDDVNKAVGMATPVPGGPQPGLQDSGKQPSRSGSPAKWTYWSCRGRRVWTNPKVERFRGQEGDSDIKNNVMLLSIMG
jgi:hypothetical protein